MDLKYVVDLIKQAFEWINSRFDQWFPNATKWQIYSAKGVALLILVIGAYLIIHPVPWEQKEGLNILTRMHTACVSGERPDWPLDWKPIPAEQKSEEKSDEKADKEDDSAGDAKSASGGKTSSSIAPIDKANNLLAAEKYEAAAKLLSRLKKTSKDEDLIPVVNNLGFAELHLGHYKDAIEDLTLACKMKDDLRASLEKKSGSRALLSGPEISSEANLGEACFYAGKLKEGKEHLAAAEDAADEVHEQLPANFRAEIVFFLGLNDLMQKDLTASIKHLQKASKLESESLKEQGEKISDSELSNWAACHTSLAVAMQAKGEITHALRLYKEIADKTSNNLTALTPESRKIITDCEQTSMPVWQRVVGTVQPPTPQGKSEE